MSARANRRKPKLVPMSKVQIGQDLLNLQFNPYDHQSVEAVQMNITKRQLQERLDNLVHEFKLQSEKQKSLEVEIEHAQRNKQALMSGLREAARSEAKKRDIQAKFTDAKLRYQSNISKLSELRGTISTLRQQELESSRNEQANTKPQLTILNPNEIPPIEDFETIMGDIPSFIDEADDEACQQYYNQIQSILQLTHTDSVYALFSRLDEAMTKTANLQNGNKLKKLRLNEVNDEIHKIGEAKVQMIKNLSEVNMVDSDSAFDEATAKLETLKRRQKDIEAIRSSMVKEFETVTIEIDKLFTQLQCSWDSCTGEHNVKSNSIFALGEIEAAIGQQMRT